MSATGSFSSTLHNYAHGHTTKWTGQIPSFLERALDTVCVGRSHVPEHAADDFRDAMHMMGFSLVLEDERDHWSVYERDGALGDDSDCSDAKGLFYPNGLVRVTADIGYDTRKITVCFCNRRGCTHKRHENEKLPAFPDGTQIVLPFPGSTQE